MSFKNKSEEHEIPCGEQQKSRSRAVINVYHQSRRDDDFKVCGHIFYDVMLSLRLRKYLISLQKNDGWTLNVFVTSGGNFPQIKDFLRPKN